ncbi:MAG: hypothetical protein OQJ96_13465 [Flavobacteriales bacterium]|nr:hypothetical protein [Flavobacteriales bacterium]MCW8912895.1 hypothetical protein [Flavobacteriales bacterium]MCW8937244.1 hypothetical protein [Flavobacteriales bacterium]MCW8940097.1 hypothetical protein [Flavobacteriales bacterium]MCW8967795.1 hypothetical protein [Flavobacteriales bacterium]
MQISEVRKIIYNELKKKKSITAQILNYTPYNIPFIQSYGVLAHLVELGAVEKNDRIYILIDEKKALGIFNDKVPAKPEIKKVKPVTVVQSRNTSKYVFEKIKRSKSQTVLHLVKAYVRDNKDITFKQLEKIFPPLIKCFGVVNTIEQARLLSPDPKRARYFFKEEHIITTKDKQRVVVCNQFVYSAFLEVLVIAKDLGYVVTPE